MTGTVFYAARTFFVEISEGNKLHGGIRYLENEEVLLRIAEAIHVNSTSLSQKLDRFLRR